MRKNMLKTRISKVLAFIPLLLLSACGDGGTGGGNASDPGANGDRTVDANAGCGRFFFHGARPAIINEKLSQKLDTLCYRSFSVGHSGVSRTALWSAEVLTPTTIELASGLKRSDRFHPETRLAKDRRAELADYRGSGYDRGHMSPSGDMPTAEAQAESFSLANMVPQSSRLNRGDWEDLEKAVRNQARRGTVYVVTGAAFKGKGLFIGPSARVMVPSHTWKAVYLVKKGITVYVATNSENPQWDMLSDNDFTQMYGIDPFPAADDAIKAKAYALMPGSHPDKGKDGSAGGGKSAFCNGKPYDYAADGSVVCHGDNGNGSGSRAGGDYGSNSRDDRNSSPERQCGGKPYTFARNGETICQGDYNSQGGGGHTSWTEKVLSPRERTGPVRDFPNDGGKQ